MADGLVAALARAQMKFPTVPKTRTAKVKMKAGGEYSYTYADLADVLNAVRPVLAAEGIALVQSTDVTEHGTVLVTRLLWGTETIEGRFPLNVAGQSPQDIGSLLTYFRRYTVTSLLGISAQDDDDGQQAQQSHARPEPEASEGHRAEVLDAISELTTTDQELVKLEIRNQKIPSLKRPGVTLSQLNGLRDFIDGLKERVEPWPLPDAGTLRNAVNSAMKAET